MALRVLARHMDVTLLGTGDATAVPAPLCDCEYCLASDRRRHPAVLIETDETTMLLDAGPDLQEQLHEVDVRSVDAVFLTHAHGDHAAGVPALSQTVKWDADHLDAVDGLAPTAEDFDPGYPFYMTDTAREHLADQYPTWFGTRLRLASIDDAETVAVGDATVTAVPVEHHRPTFQTLGFLVEAGGARLLYAPDMRSWVDGPPAADVDLLVCEGAAVLGQPVHGPAEALLAAIDGVGAERTVLVNVNEHLQRAHTGELRQVAAEQGSRSSRTSRQSRSERPQGPSRQGSLGVSAWADEVRSEGRPSGRPSARASEPPPNGKALYDAPRSDRGWSASSPGPDDATAWPARCWLRSSPPPGA